MLCCDQNSVISSEKKYGIVPALLCVNSRSRRFQLKGKVAQACWIKLSCPSPIHFSESWLHVHVSQLTSYRFSNLKNHCLVFSTLLCFSSIQDDFKGGGESKLKTRTRKTPDDLYLKRWLLKKSLPELTQLLFHLFEIKLLVNWIP